MDRWKHDFRRAADPEGVWTLSELRDLLARVDGLPPPPAGGARILPYAELEPLHVRAVLRATQPMAAVLGAPLHTLSSPCVFEDVGHLAVLAAHAEEVGVGSPGASRFDAFHRTMVRHGLSEEATSRAEIGDVVAIDDALFALPAVLLALSRRPDRFVAELLGVDDALRRAGLLRPWAELAERGVDGEWDRLAGAGDDHRTVGDRVREIAGAVDDERAAWGRQLATVLLAHWEHAVGRAVAVQADPRAAMAEMLRLRAGEAAVYHEHSRLGQQSLQQWFAGALDDPYTLVDELARSRYIRPGDPDRSPLLARLSAFGGPMFRVFSREDTEVIRRWVRSLDDPQDDPRPAPAVEVAAAPSPARFADCARLRGPEPARRPESLREAYVALQGRDTSPHVQAFARDYVAWWLGLAGASLDVHPFPLPEQVPGQGSLRAWLHDAHARHADAVDLDANLESLPSREQVIESTVQLAPLTLIDGSWLTGFTDVSLASTRIGHSLFETYWDELGNGQILINHPKLYRDVLRGMDVELPPTGSVEFAADERLREESFELPVYWLAIGRFPNSHRAEVLGLNLAMELSGVGGTYRTARQAFRAHGFPTVFVDIHNTIDNVSTGHSAWAAEAVEAHLAQLRRHGATRDEVAAAWLRVRTGFASLSPRREPGGFFGAARRERPRLLGRRQRVTPAPGHVPAEATRTHVEAITGPHRVLVGSPR